MGSVGMVMAASLASVPVDLTINRTMENLARCFLLYFVIQISKPMPSSAISTLLNSVCASIC